MNNYADQNWRLKQTLNLRRNASFIQVSFYLFIIIFFNELVQVWRFLQLLLQKNQTHLDYLCKFWIPISVFGNLWGFNALLDVHHQHGAIVLVFLEHLMFSHIVSSCLVFICYIFWSCGIFFILYSLIIFGPIRIDCK